MKKKHNLNQHRRSVLIWAAAVLFLLTASGTWIGLRITTPVSPCRQPVKSVNETRSETDLVLDAIALSDFVYGCEREEQLSGMVSEIISGHTMGILTENIGLRRSDPDDPDSVLFDTAGFVMDRIREYRFLTDLKDEKSGFYGAVFADDAEKCIWIAYAGSVDFKDAAACACFVLAPRFSTQESEALELYEKACDHIEIRDQEYRLLLTGHSFGGTLASEVSCITGNRAITVNGADGIAVSKLRMMKYVGSTGWPVTNYMTHPDTGDLSFRDWVQRLMYAGRWADIDSHVYNGNDFASDTHSPFSFILLSDTGGFGLPGER